VEHAALFAGHEELLQSHRGWDRGALEMAHHVARRLRAPLFAAETTRLLVDLNRSVDHPEVFSELTRHLLPEDRDGLLEMYYFPYRHGVETDVAARVAGGEAVVHLSVHTFTPTWESRRRDVDVGVLFDPDHGPEAELSARLRREIEQRLPDLRVRDNEPYLGVADGFTSYLRRRFAARSYMGIELEVSTGVVDERGTTWGCMGEHLAEATATTLAASQPARGARPE
jgi:predicted N-formylglutamate amidohydrolase